MFFIRYMQYVILIFLLYIPLHTPSAANPIAFQCNSETVCQLDGNLDKAVWRLAPVFEDFQEYSPHNGNPPQYKTTFQIAYDTKAIYFAIHAFDPHPNEIRAPLARHDTITTDQDYVSVMIDPIGSRKSAQFFRVSPSGATAEGTYTAETDNLDIAPDFDWDAISKRIPDGYTTEIKIPFSSLRYSSTPLSSWRMMIARVIPREQRHILLSVALPNDAPSFIAALQTLDSLEQPHTPQFLQIRPTVTLRRSEENMNASNNHAINAALGLDIKARPSTNVILDATIHPDFSQVEIDEPQLNRNIQFALSTPEKRPFFLESSDLLQGPTNSIYTRTITNPQWGLRATLRDDAMSGTLFSAADSGCGAILIPTPYYTDMVFQPKSQATVARAFWHSPTFSINGLAAVRDYHEKGVNNVGGAGIGWQFSESQRLRAQWLHSYSTALPDNTGQLSQQHAVNGQDLFLDYLVRTESDDATMTYVRTSKGFRNDIGFTSQNGYHSWSAVYNHTWRNKWMLNELRVYLNGNVAKALDNQLIISSGVTPGIYFAGKNGLEVTLEPHVTDKNRTTAEGTLISPRYLHSEIIYSPAPWLPKFSGKIDIGKLVDFDTGIVRTGRIIGLGALLRIGDHFEADPRIQQTILNNNSGKIFSETTWRLLCVLHLDARSAIRLIAQSHFNSRVSDPTDNMFQQRDNANSLTFIHRRSSSTIFYLGYVEQAKGIANLRTKSKELFMKLQIGL